MVAESAGVFADPLTTGETEPTPLLMVSVSPFVVVHDSTECSPLFIEVGDAVSVQVGAAGGGGRSVTVIVAEQSAEPPRPVAVPV